MTGPAILRAVHVGTVLFLAPALLVGCSGSGSGPDTLEGLAEAALVPVEGELDVPGLRGPVQILRDEWGIPHVYAESMEDLFLAQGFVQAQDRLWQMDMWRRTNEGRLAEILGSEAIAHDRLARLLQYRGSWDDEFATYHPDGAMIFERFAEGVNALIASLGDNLPVEYQLTGLKPLPWTPQSSTGRVATALPIGAARSEIALARRLAEQGIEAINARESSRHSNWIDLVVPEELEYGLISEEASAALGHFMSNFPAPPLLPRYSRMDEAVLSPNLGAVETSPGSNNWVAAPSLTRSGKVLLANDPHRGVTNPSLRYLIHLNAPGYSVIGSTEPSIPGVAIGHNGKVAWGLTIVGTDQADVFLEKLNPDNHDEVMENGAWVPLQLEVDTILVRDRAPEIVVHRFSRNGPIFHVDEENHLAYAVRSTSTEPGTGGYLGALRLAETENCREFIDALAYYHAPSENMICGDADGNIAWLAAALTPRRVGWYGRLPVPGWTDAYRWDGFRPHTELPQAFNPASGWLGTANHDIQPPGYSPPIMFRPAASARWDRLQAMFRGAGGLTPEDFERMIFDALHPWFEEQRGLLEGWSSDDEAVEWARTTLLAWDGVYDRTQAAPAIHNQWSSRLGDERNAEAAERALEVALRNLNERLGEDRSSWRWGQIHRSEFPHTLVRAYDLPSVERNGGGGGTIAATGATFRQIIDFADLDNSRVTSTPGQSMQPGSRFYGNLLPLWGSETFFPLLYSREAVEAHVSAYQVLNPPR
jgi:penicillin G amidase